VSAILEVSGLSRRFGEHHALSGVDLVVAERGVHAVIGPNGAGKTTLFNCISGALRPDGGRVGLRGEDITQRSVVERVRLGLVRTFQVSRVFNGLSVIQNVQLALQKNHVRGRVGLHIRAAVRRDIDLRSRELLDTVGILPAAHEVPADRLSYGDRRAVEVAMALACDPVLLCLDEPTAGMGLREAERLAAMVGELGERLAVLLIEHRMSMVHEIAQQVTVLSSGAVLAEGTPAAVAGSELVRDAYLGHPRERPAPAARPPRAAPAAADGADLRLDGVHSYYGRSHVLQGVDLIAREGQVTGVLGRNGAGKTTTLKSIMGLVSVRSGSICLGTRELRGVPTYGIARAGVALVPEERWVFPELTVEQNIRVAGGAGTVLEEVYEQFPVLLERRDSKGSELSGGQQQMLAFARAIVARPRLILLDEPTQGLSPAFVDVVVRYIERLRERRITVVIVEQRLDVVAGVSDTVYLMSDGRIAAQLDPGELELDNPVLAEHLLVGAASAND
jgi:branched-chain amino acid transport system ATP-binding protein